MKDEPDTTWQTIKSKGLKDFDEGIVFFISSGQVFRVEVETGPAIKPSG